MDFELTEDQRLIQDTARDFADKELAPLAAAIDQKQIFPREPMKKLAALGFLGMVVPEEYGGTGLGNLPLVLALEQINRVCASTGVTLSVHNSLVCSPLVRHGSEDLKKRCLPKLARGEWLGAYSLSEPASGSDAAALRTTAVREGDSYVLNGSKVFVTTGGEADLILIFARVGPVKPDKKSEGVTCFAVEKTFPGFRAGSPEHKMGIRGSNTVALFLDGCRVPASNILGTEGKGFRVAMDTLDGGRIGIAAQALGIAQGCLDESVKYSKERHQFGKAIAEFEAIQWKLAEMAMDIDAGRLLTYRAAQLRDQGKPHTQQAAMAKLFTSTMANKHASQAVQIHGGVGYTKEFKVERFFRDAKITEIYEGTSEIQKMVIARGLLK